MQTDTRTPTVQQYADERWAELGERLDRAHVALTTLARDAGSRESRERLNAKAAAVAEAKADWVHVGEKDEVNRGFALLKILLCRKESARSTGEVSGYSLAVDYMIGV